MMQDTISWYSRIPRWLILLFVILAVYGRAATFEFVIWDDGELISGNSHVTGPSPLSAWTGPHLGMYIPVTYNLWWMLARIGMYFQTGPGHSTIPPWPFHIANLIVHFANALLVLGILTRIGMHRAAGLFGALIFAVHPLQVESVAWATAMKDLLSTCFALVSILTWLEASAWFRARRPVGAHAWYSLSLVCLLLGTLAKPGVFGAPMIAALLDAAFVGGWQRAILWRLGGSLCVILPAAIWTRNAQQFPEFEGVSRVFRPTIAANAIGFYLAKLFAPSQLCVIYGLEPRVVVTQWKHVFLAMLAVTPLVGILLARGHRKVLATSLIVFVLGVFPVLGFVPFVFQALSTVADRYVYLSMLGVAIASAHVMTIVPKRSRMVAASVILIGLSALSWKQTLVWHDTLSLMGHCISVNPRAAVAYNNFACAVCPSPDLQDWLREKWKDSRATAPALPRPEVSDEMVEIADGYYRIAFGLRPKYVDPLKNMIQNRALRGRYKEAYDLGEYAVRIGPTLGWDGLAKVVHPYSLGWLSLQVGNKQRARELFAIAVRMEPTNVQALNMLGELTRKEGPSTEPR